MRAPLGAQDVIYKDPNGALHCHVLGTRAAAFLFLDGSAVCFSRARGTIGDSIHQDGEPLRWPRTPPSGNSEVLAPKFFLRTKYYTISPRTGLLTQPGGRLYVLCDAAEY